MSAALPLKSLLSRLGLGTWVFGRVGFSPQDDRDSIAAILRAVECGVRWIDTAAVYGDGHAERIAGRALARLPAREHPLLFTKGGISVDRNGRTRRDLSPRALRAGCEASLGRLGVERIDLYQLHWPVGEHALVMAAWETLAELKREGKIRWAGASNFDVELLQRCEQLHAVDAVQLPLSLLSRDMAAEVIPWATRAGAAVIVYSPLESGLLAGRFSREHLATRPPEDWRRRRPQFQAPQFQRTLALVERLRSLAVELNISLVELAVAWTLAWPGVSGAIVGARTPAQLDAWIGAADVELGEPALAEIAAALTGTEAGSGPTRPPRAQITPVTRP